MTPPCAAFTAPRAVPMRRAGSSPCTTPRCALPGGGDGDDGGMQLAARRRAVADALRTDLPRQYNAPGAMDWSVYDRRVTFDDPMTNLDGLLLYKGMIFTIAIIVRTLCRPGTASFSLPECDVVPDGSKVRTRFETAAVTRWGARFRISGEDYFWFGADHARIVRHESRWDQTADEVTDAFLGRAGGTGGPSEN